MEKAQLKMAVSRTRQDRTGKISKKIIMLIETGTGRDISDAM